MNNSLDNLDLVLIQKALGAYLLHLEKDAMYSEEVKTWSERVHQVRHKVIDILIDGEQNEL